MLLYPIIASFHYFSHRERELWCMIRKPFIFHYNQFDGYESVGDLLSKIRILNYAVDFAVYLVVYTISKLLTICFLISAKVINICRKIKTILKRWITGPPIFKIWSIYKRIVYLWWGFLNWDCTSDRTLGYLSYFAVNGTQWNITNIS